MRTEKILMSFFILGLFFKFFDLTFDSYILTVSLASLSLIYLIAAFYFFNDGDLKRQNLPLSIISGILLSIIPIGILFKLQHWAGGNNYLHIGILVTPVLLLMTFYLSKKSVEDLKTYYFQMKIRITTLLILSVLFYLI